MEHFKEKVIYQIWPRSFKDSNGDGIGDIQGIISKLEHIQSLGVDAIWLSPVYTSPNKDYGYDISDYYNINPEFGSMADFDEMLAKAKHLGLGIIMDLVANHTSDQHAWFQKALKDPNSKYRDYYYFKDGKDDKEPNNWIGLFGGSAWQKEPGTENGYYLTSFTPNQTDLNWANPEVRTEIFKMMNFWLEKGVMGFRMDVINTIGKTEGLPDKDPHKKGYQFAKELMINLDVSHEYLREMHDEVIRKYPEGIFFGEGMLADMESCRLYSGADTRELQMMLNFDMALIGTGPLGKFDFRKLYHWNTKGLKKMLFAWQEDMQKHNYWIANFISNHDFPRPVSRFGDDKKYRKESAKALALLNFTLGGTPLMYQGEEIGMTNMKLDMDQWRDFEAKSIYEELQTMMKVPAPLAKKIVQKMTRDHARTPVQWSKDKNAGFTTGEPWMDVNPNYKKINVERDLKSKDSLIKYYQKVIALRKEYRSLMVGSFTPMLVKDKHIIAYERALDDEKLLVVINLSKRSQKLSLPYYVETTLILNTYDDKEAGSPNILRPYESRIYKVK